MRLSSVSTESVQYGESVREAAFNTFKSACGVEIARLDQDSLYANPFVLAVISLVGDVDWTVFLGLPQKTAVAMARNFTGFEIPFESDELGDAVGELSNVLAGDIKFRLDKQGVKENISLPCVVTDGDLRVMIPKDSTVMKFCFDSPAGKLLVGVICKKKDH